MKPMFSYFGSKWLLARHYGPPVTGLVIESFAGSACYALYWNAPVVWLYDVNPVIAGIWEYLIHVKESEVKLLPLEFESLETLRIPQEAKWLIGFWCAKGNSVPASERNAWARKYNLSEDCKVWGDPVRTRIATQVSKIRSWKIFNKDYAKVSPSRADWFTDPPYASRSGYPFNSVSYPALAGFAVSRKGRVTVCEMGTADWLPFKPFRWSRVVRAPRGASSQSNLEVIYQVIT